MAGIEQLEIHSKSYIVRWVKVDQGNTISWTVQPHKKSINFGIVKHPGSGGTNLTTSQYENASSSDLQSDEIPDAKTGLFTKKDNSTAQDQLSKKGFIPVKWHGKCEADKVSMGTYDVTSGGMFGLVFDNTFSKQTSKNATFVLLIYPVGAPPQTGKTLPNLQAGPNASSSRTSLGKQSPRLGGIGSDSNDSLHSHRPGAGRALSATGRSEGTTTPASYHVGTLHKRRRKKGQGYARRFFSLDYTTCTLSYYHDRNTSALRGAIPLSLAAIAADERRREITIDSGAEVWHLRASNAKEFTEWARALERASRIARGLETLADDSALETAQANRRSLIHSNTQQDEDREWQQVEALVSRIVGTRDALRRLVKDTAAQKHASAYLSPGTPTLSEESDSYFTPQPEKRAFWKRKSSGSALAHQNFSPPVSSGLAASSSEATTPLPKNDMDSKRKSKLHVPSERNMLDHCTALLGDLDSVVLEFSSLLSTSKWRRMPVAPSGASRKSIESATTEEFFDAEAGDSQVLMIGDQSDEEDADEASIHDSSSISSVEDDDTIYAKDGSNNLHPVKPKSLTPLPISESVERRTTIPPATVLPPSLIAFVRKNVGKDLSTISMPVSANEPTSLLQRMAEQLEYAYLLDAAAKQKHARDRLLYVTAFAVSHFSCSRAKERSIRKPFNPLLGETFELVRTQADTPSGGFRLLVEKVSHRPVRLAMQADGATWSFAQSPAPTQKFWGKSAELATEGRVRVALRLPDGTDERYSWATATVFLRNVVMGEKYVEPVGTTAVHNDDTGARASIEFRSARGMFGGRGEDVRVETFGPGGGGEKTGWGLEGTWTGGLRIVEPGRPTGSGAEIWKPGKLVENAAQTYGMTAFAASLNEITALESGRLPPTDSRMRPDQRLAEKGKLDEAEGMKTKLEEAQRSRRNALEESGVEHRPKWFVKMTALDGGEEVWKMKGGKEGYWEERAKGGWNGIEDIFAV